MAQPVPKDFSNPVAIHYVLGNRKKKTQLSPKHKSVLFEKILTIHNFKVIFVYLSTIIKPKSKVHVSLGYLKS